MLASCSIRNSVNSCTEISKVARHQSVNTFQPNFVLLLVFSDTWLTILVEIKKPPLELLFQNSFGRTLSGGGGGLLLEILGGGVLPGSSNPQPNIRPKKLFKCISNTHISLLSYSFGTETINRYSLENHARFKTKMGKQFDV